MKENDVRLDDAIRLCRLVREHTLATRRVASLERRILRLLDDTPEDTALRSTTLATLHAAVAELSAEASVLALAAREPCERVDDNPGPEHDTTDA